MMRAVFRSEGGALETKQMTLATAGFAIKTKVTRRAQFLAEMDKVVPWSRLLAVIEPLRGAPFGSFCRASLGYFCGRKAHRQARSTLSR
jgi:hypothetical protein